VSTRVLHQSLASVTAAAAFALLVAATVAQLHRSPASISLVLLVRRVAIVAAAMAALTGVVLLVNGRRPREALHLLYGFLAIAAVPLAASLAARNPRRGGLYHLLAGVLLLGLCFRLAGTG
jgi:hypothetical protein